MKVGDLVICKYDRDRGIHAVGIVTDYKWRGGLNVKVRWCLESQTNPDIPDEFQWYAEEKLELYQSVSE